MLRGIRQGNPEEPFLYQDSENERIVRRKWCTTQAGWRRCADHDQTDGVAATLRASLSGELDTPMKGHSLSPRTCSDHDQTDGVAATLRASLSGTFFQTLPELLTPLKGHSIFISAHLSGRHRRCQRPPKGLNINKTVEARLRPSTHVNMRRVRPWVKTRVPSRSKRFWFYLSWRKQRAGS